MHLLLDALYFIPSEDGVPYVIEGSHVKNPAMKWGWGFRLGLAEDFAHDDWKASLVWTCLPTQHDTQTQGHLTPIWSNAPQVPEDFVTESKVHWRLHLGIVDLDLEKKWMVSEHLNLQPHLGLRFASLREKFFVRYAGGSLFPEGVDNMHSKNKFWGVGPEAGLHANWNVGKHWFLVGKSTASITYGEFYVHQAERKEGSGFSFLRLHDVFSQAAFLLDFALGIAWKIDNFESHLMWEEHFFPGQNHLTPFTQNRQIPTHPGSISVMGLSLGFDWKF
ncbi:MAG: hypothetical protein JSR58_03900 [Verrucomicrobia bacterium]|nr:hypothetical protein [Verrucomicrobiota bacterium]